MIFNHLLTESLQSLTGNSYPEGRLKRRWRQAGGFHVIPPPVRSRPLRREHSNTGESGGKDDMPSERATEEVRPSGGRYHAEHVRLTQETEPQQQLQSVLDAAEEKEWHLVGVAGGLPEGGMILFWDTKRPSFGRTSR